MDKGASPDGDRAGGPTDLSRCASQPEALIPSADDVRLIHAGPAPGGGFEFSFRDGEEYGVIHHIAAHLAGMMRLDSDKPLNCIEMTVHPSGHPELVLTMQRKGGKTPVQLKAEAVKLLQDTLAAIETGRSEPLFIARDLLRNWLADDTTAQAIEARRAETGTGSVHESAVAEGHAPKGDHP